MRRERLTMMTPSKSKNSKTPTVEIDKTQLPAVPGDHVPTVPEGAVEIIGSANALTAQYRVREIAAASLTTRVGGAAANFTGEIFGARAKDRSITSEIADHIGGGGQISAVATKGNPTDEKFIAEYKRLSGSSRLTTASASAAAALSEAILAALLVRARREGDIQKVFPDAKVIKSTDTDYLYRAVMPRKEVATAVAAQIQDIDYGNFKSSVDDEFETYLEVWQAMAALQSPPPYSGF
jgi:hypothetical protein